MKHWYSGCLRKPVGDWFKTEKLKYLSGLWAESTWGLLLWDVVEADTVSRPKGERG